MIFLRGCLVLFLMMIAWQSPEFAFAFNDRSMAVDRPCPPSSILGCIEGSFGALVMLVSFVGGIFALGAFAIHKSRSMILVGGTLLVISVGTFVGRSMVATFKPVIYLYPTIQTEVQVDLEYDGELTVTYPSYDSSIGGWKVRALPDGTLFDLRDNREYSYLFWEGVLSSEIYKMPKEGFIVSGQESADFLRTFLKEIGLTPREFNEFIVFWYPQIMNFPYVQIALAGPEYEESARLSISPEPDSLLRVFVYFKRLSKPKEIAPQSITSFIREGFSVVEWGGTIIE